MIFQVSASFNNGIQLVEISARRNMTFLQMSVHPNKLGNLEVINLLCENSSKHIAASFPDGEICIQQAVD